MVSCSRTAASFVLDKAAHTACYGVSVFLIVATLAVSCCVIMRAFKMRDFHWNGIADISNDTGITFRLHLPQPAKPV